jgi:hypothetical protein
MNTSFYLNQIGERMITRNQVTSMMSLYTTDINKFKYYYGITLCVAKTDDKYMAKLFNYLFPGDHDSNLSYELSQIKF